MRAIRTAPFASLIGLAVVAAVAPRAGLGDVTIQQRTQMEYRETPWPTAAQLAAARQEAHATMEKIEQCPAAAQHPAPAPDTSKCEMSPPRFDVKQPGVHALLAGHDTQLTQIAFTQSCTNRTTGDVCDILIASDTWLTQDQRRHG
jgi:hypothetical protein